MWAWQAGRTRVERLSAAAVCAVCLPPGLRAGEARKNEGERKGTEGLWQGERQEAGEGGRNMVYRGLAKRTATRHDRAIYKTSQDSGGDTRAWDVCQTSRVARCRAVEPGLDIVVWVHIGYIGFASQGGQAGNPRRRGGLRYQGQEEEVLTACHWAGGWSWSRRTPARGRPAMAA